MTRSKALFDYSHQYLSTGEVVFKKYGGGAELRFPFRDFEALGKPLEITVTVEPGDTLNNHPAGAL